MRSRSLGRARAIVVAALAFIAVIVFTSQAQAHASLDRALPAQGSTVRASPAQARLWFTQRIEPAFSYVRVYDAKGARVDKDDSSPSAADATELRVSLPMLAPGTYRVQWRVLSVDTHVSEGEFKFDVAP